MQRIVGLALLATLALAAATAVPAQDLSGKGGVGGSVGIMKYYAGEDWKNGSLRFIGQAVFKYHVTNSWGIALEGGGGWNNNGGTGPSDTLSVVYPFTLGAFYRFQAGSSTFWPSFGGGVGLYALGIKDSPNTWAREVGPGSQETNERLTWQAPGLYGRAGGEFMFSDSFSCNIDALLHYVFAKDDRFTRFGNSNTGFFQARIGLNYYFSVGGGGDGDSEAAPADDEGGE